MIKPHYNFKDVTLLITHYNRSTSLEKLLKGFQALNCEFENVVVSDDGSKAEQLDYVKELQERYGFQLVTTPVNRGLGNNINKGQEVVTTSYTLYIQEDFVPKDVFPEHFFNALTIMREDPKWDMVTLYSYSPYPYLKPYKLGFSEKVFHLSPLYTNNLKFYLYGDHPHLRKTSFPKDFGKYIEGANVDITEMEMSLAFIKNHGKCLFYNDHYGLLTQENSVEEPSTAAYRKDWKNTNSAPMVFAKWCYAKIKFMKLNYRLFTKKVEY